jgi:hypothetical protein
VDVGVVTAALAACGDSGGDRDSASASAPVTVRGGSIGTVTNVNSTSGATEGLTTGTGQQSFSVIIVGFDQYDSCAYLGGTGTGKINPNPPG